MATAKTPTLTGWLVKEGGSWKSWKKRYFVLDCDKYVLSYYKKDTVCDYTHTTHARTVRTAIAAAMVLTCTAVVVGHKRRLCL